MAKGEYLPPPSRGAKKGPEMADEDPSIYGRLSALADREAGGGMGGMGGMGGAGGDQESAQLLMDGAGQLMQAARMNPSLAPFIMQAIQILQQGVQQMAGGAGGEASLPGGMPGQGGTPSPRRRRMRPPQAETGAEGYGV